MTDNVKPLYVVEIYTDPTVDEMWKALRVCVPALPTWDEATERQKDIARRFYVSDCEDLNELARQLALMHVCDNPSKAK